MSASTLSHSGHPTFSDSCPSTITDSRKTSRSRHMPEPLRLNIVVYYTYMHWFAFNRPRVGSGRPEDKERTKGQRKRKRQRKKIIFIPSRAGPGGRQGKKLPRPLSPRTVVSHAPTAESGQQTETDTGRTLVCVCDGDDDDDDSYEYVRRRDLQF